MVVSKKFHTGDTSKLEEDEMRHDGLDSYVIRTEGEGAKPMMVAPGYSRALMVPLVNDLSNLVGTARRGVLDRDESPAVEVSEEVGEPEESDTDKPWEPEEVPLAPDGTDIEYQEHSDGCSFLFRPVGVWRGSKGLMFFSLIWNGFIALFVGAFVWAHVTGRTDNEPIPIFVWAIMALFVLIGIGILMQAISMGRRRAAIVVTGDGVSIKQMGLFKTQEKKYFGKDLKAIRLGHSGMAVNDVPIMELQFIPADASGKFGLLSERIDDDLAWVAALLRNRLRVGK